MKKVAVFDIDGTIFRSSLLIEITEALIQEGIFKRQISGIYIKAYQDWMARRDSYEKYIDLVVKAFLENIKNVKHQDFLRISKKVFAFHKNRIYRYTRGLVKSFKKKNYYILAISNSPKEILDEFCRNWGFNKVYGRIYEVGKNGKFTGKILHADIVSDKAKTLQRAIEKEKLTLKGSFGVGDSESDINFLKIVENQICFNPNKKLYDYAKKAKWKIVVERKDVIYDIQ